MTRDFGDSIYAIAGVDDGADYTATLVEDV
jgi:hypothetical protein